ncbi:POU domain protein [Caerostris extrusa]|uniref:POU domain protein n=1 Tax=Caerostris extrusa TaxID=172846 RepID=A0AAV4Y6B1_CAEEX|nr:POU domain protein [Caerostris extrusa]
MVPMAATTVINQAGQLQHGMMAMPDPNNPEQLVVVQNMNNGTNMDDKTMINAGSLPSSLQMTKFNNTPTNAGMFQHITKCQAKLRFCSNNLEIQHVYLLKCREVHTKGMVAVNGHPNAVQQTQVGNTPQFILAAGQPIQGIQGVATQQGNPSKRSIPPHACSGFTNMSGQVASMPQIFTQCSWATCNLGPQVIAHPMMGGNPTKSNGTISNTEANVVDGINLEEIKDFAKAFKIRRLSLGLTQTQVGQALSATEDLLTVKEMLYADLKNLTLHQEVPRKLNQF